ncbi:polysaccharide biosynthesis/export family protein [Novosphingobium sp.]|uniref:polysaccharide biosynthesis/export family protein n=1 Tax=Novosphingobium sp. TaxID=1874826 RepID=UPI0038BA33D1
MIFDVGANFSATGRTLDRPAKELWKPVRKEISLAAASCALLLNGCAGSEFNALPTGTQAYKIIPEVAKEAAETPYQLQPGDELAFDVLDEPTLAIEKLPVDQSGRIQLPLIGSLKVKGMTPAEASALIEQMLAAKYLRTPHVTLNVTTPVVQTVTVEGQVTKAGTYPVDTQTTLLTAISMAQSPTRIAKLDEVIVFRTANGNRLAARFDLKRIRAGLDPDPQILGGDAVVVGFSSAKSIYRDALAAAPIFNIFTRF